MKLFIFLGNIGKKYEKTRHNAGFLLADFLQKKWGFSAWKEEKKFFSVCTEGSWNGEKILFIKPTTYMNLSGKAVFAVQNFYKIPLENMCVFYDDKDLPFSEIRFRQKGSAGGHNGIKNIISVLGTDIFDRFKMGVDTENRNFFDSTADFVLSRFSSEELETLHFEIFPAVEKKIQENLFTFSTSV